MKPSIAIIGGGPSGLAAAIALKKQLPDALITVMEKSNYDKFRPGETVPNRFGKLLQTLGLWDAFEEQDHWPAYGKRILWGGNSQWENSIFEPEGRGWHLSRPAFDHWLVGIAEGLGVNVHQEVSGIRLTRLEKGWSMGWSGNKKRIVDFVINASGVPMNIDKQQEIKKNKFDHLVATYFEGKRVGDHTYTTIAAAHNGWWYHCNVREQSVFAFFTDPTYLRNTVLKSGEDFLNELPPDEELIGSFEAITDDLAPNWFNIIPQRSTSSGAFWLAVGDAALRYDPLSGQGIYKAFETAIWASYALSDHFNGVSDALKKYDRIVDSMTNSYANFREQFYGQMDQYTTGFWERRVVLVN